MRRKPSKTMLVEDGRPFLTSKREIDYFYQELRFKIQWLNFGPYCILSCRSYLIIMSSS